MSETRQGVLQGPITFSQESQTYLQVKSPSNVALSTYTLSSNQASENTSIILPSIIYWCCLKLSLIGGYRYKCQV